jgi:hypothetical protein
LIYEKSHKMWYPDAPWCWNIKTNFSPCPKNHRVLYLYIYTHKYTSTMVRIWERFFINHPRDIICSMNGMFANICPKNHPVL